MIERYLSVNEARDLIGVSRQTIYREIEARRLKAIRIPVGESGRTRVRISEHSLLTWMSRNDAA